MKKLLLASAATLAGTAALAAGHSEEIKLGIILGFTGKTRYQNPFGRLQRKKDL